MQMFSIVDIVLKWKRKEDDMYYVRISELFFLSFGEDEEKWTKEQRNFVDFHIDKATMKQFQRYYGG